MRLAAGRAPGPEYESFVGACLRGAGLRTERLFPDAGRALWTHDGSDRPALLFVAHCGPEGGPLAGAGRPASPAAGSGGAHRPPTRPAHHATTAAWLAALTRFRRRRPNGLAVAVLVMEPFKGGRASLVARALNELTRRGVRVDRALVGEPMSRARAADVVCNAGSGRASGVLTVKGTQGHVAYPDRADNPIHRFCRIAAALESTISGAGDGDGALGSVAITAVRAGTGATNVIPGELRAELDLCLAPEAAPRDACRRIEAVLAGHGSEHDLRWDTVLDPFLTGSGALLKAVVEAIEEEDRVRPRVEHARARTVSSGVAASISQVLAVGAVASAADTDIAASAADLERLSRIYEGVLERLRSAP